MVEAARNNKSWGGHVYSSRERRKKKLAHGHQTCRCICLVYILNLTDFPPFGNQGGATEDWWEIWAVSHKRIAQGIDHNEKAMPTVLLTWLINEWSITTHTHFSVYLFYKSWKFPVIFWIIISFCRGNLSR